MSIEWSYILKASAPARPPDPLADPLAGDDWRGLSWAVSALALLVRSSGAAVAPAGRLSEGKEHGGVAAENRI